MGGEGGVHISFDCWGIWNDYIDFSLISEVKLANSYKSVLSTLSILKNITLILSSNLQIFYLHVLKINLAHKFHLILKWINGGGRGGGLGNGNVHNQNACLMT